MSKPKKQTGRYIVEINDWGCGTLIKDTLTGKEIDAPAEETVNLCIIEMNQLAAEVERLRKAGDMCDQLLACFEMEGRRGVNVGRDMWRAAKEGKQP